MTICESRLVLGIDPAPRGIGYVVFDDGALVDAGLLSTRGVRHTASSRISELLDDYRPDVIVLEDPDVTSCGRAPDIRQLLRATARAAKRRRIQAALVSRATVRESWSRRGVMNKQAMAARIAEDFPELDRFVPPPRKAWESEDQRVHVFDAASLVLHRFEPSSLHEPAA